MWSSSSWGGELPTSFNDVDTTPKSRCTSAASARRASGDIIPLRICPHRGCGFPRATDTRQSAVRSGPLLKEEEYDRTGHKKIRKTWILRILPTGIAGLGGERGIRTPGTVARTPHFECGPIDHSGTSPFSFAPQPAKPFGAGIRAKPARGSFRSANIGIIFSLPHIRDKNFARNDIFSPKPQIIPIFGRDCKTLPATASHVPVARNDRRIRKRVRFSLSE